MKEYYHLKAKDFIPLLGAIKYRDTMELEMKSHPEDRGKIIGRAVVLALFNYTVFTAGVVACSKGLEGILK
ncbi:MAG: hypothetical protein AABX91_02445 [Nanoarchaeota archaeon]